MTNRQHSVPFSSAMIQLEMDSIYGNGGVLILEVFAKDPKFIYLMIVKRLRKSSSTKTKASSDGKMVNEFRKRFPAQRENICISHILKRKSPSFPKSNKSQSLLIQVSHFY